MSKQITIFLSLVLFLTACTSQQQAQTVEVTRIVQLPATQLVTQEVTRQVEVTRIVKQEVTRVVVEKPTVTPTPEQINPSNAFSMNYLGAVEQDGITVELARVIFAHRDAFKPDTSFDDSERFDGEEFISEIIWRITNNTDKNIQWGYDDINVRVNERQINLYDYLFHTFGESPTDEIFPGSTIVGGVWYGIGNMKPDEIKSISLLMGQARDADSFRSLTGNFIIDADLSGEHQWFALPDELQ